MTAMIDVPALSEVMPAIKADDAQLQGVGGEVEYA
jgi:hypothetical protein